MRVATAFAALVLFAGSAFAQEKFDNPEFASWSKHKPGTSITLKSSVMSGAVKSETTITTTLVEVGSDKLVLEMATTTHVNGMEFKNPPMKRDVAKTLELPKGTPKPDPNKKPEGVIEEGTEDVKIGTATVKAKWYKAKTKVGETETEAKSWVSDEVPGGFVKLEATSKGPNAATFTMEVIAFKKP